MSIVYSLKELSLNNTILIVDDSNNLRAHLSEFLERFFINVYSAKDGSEGIDVFKKQKPDIVITDIQMPEINGLNMIKTIKSFSPDTPIIIMSAYDEKKYLMESIKYGIVDYLKKPVKIDVLCEVLIGVLKKIKEQNSKKLFYKYTNDLFKKQNSLILLYERNLPVMANPAFLEFFNVNNLQEFKDKYSDIGDYFLKQDEFLFNCDENWFSKISKNLGSHFHVKISDKNHKHHHFLLKYISLSDKDGYGLLSLDDITELNLLALFNVDDTDADDMYFKNKETIEKSINHLLHSNEYLNVYNFFKGLSITNKSKIVSFENEIITLEVNTNQIIASRHERSLILGSEMLPNFILCENIIDFNDERKYITATSLKFMKSNPTKRKNIRVEPGTDHKISLFFKLKEFHGDISIVDLSIDGIKLKMNSLLVGMRDGESLEISTVLARNSDNIHFDIHAKILRINKQDGFFYVAVKFDLSDDLKKSLTKYISKRQIELIKEFKSLNI